MSAAASDVVLGPLDRTRPAEAVLASVVSVLFTCLAMAWSYSAKVVVAVRRSMRRGGRGVG